MIPDKFFSILVAGTTLLFAIESAQAQTSVLTYHNNNTRSGLNPFETILTPGNVNSSKFGKLFFVSTDGRVDAQPLYVSGLSIGGRTRNVLYIATEHDTVYAVDADSGTSLWDTSLLRSGEIPADTRGCGQVAPEIGITATPVIDPHRGPNGAIYVVAMAKDSSGKYYQKLHALDLVTGDEVLGGPVAITATYPGSGAGSSNGRVTFDPKQYKERSGLLLLNGAIYTTWASHCDIPPYTGWIIAYSAANLHQTSVFNFTPNGNDGAVWGAGAGPAADSNGNIYFLVGNGTFDEELGSRGFPQKGNYGNAFLKLSTSGGKLAISDYFSMYNTTIESNADVDLGSGGAMLFDTWDSQNRFRNLAIGAGKDGHIYVVDRNNMGKFNPVGNRNYQDLASSLAGSIYSAPAIFANRIYFGAISDRIRAFALQGGKLMPSAVSRTSIVFRYPGATPSISANVGANGILWAVESSTPATLHAYDALNLSRELYNSNQASSRRDNFGLSNKYETLTIANGKLYVATQDGVGAFGLLNRRTPLNYETTSLQASSSGPAHREFDWPGLTDGAGTILDSTASGQYVNYLVSVPQAGPYNVRVGTKENNVRGRWQLSVNGINHGAVQDEYSSFDTWAEIDAGIVDLSTSGTKQFRFTVTGKNPASGGYSLTFDYIKLIPQ